MPTPTHTSIHETAFRTSLRQGRAPSFRLGEVEFQAFKNAAPPPEEGIDRNSGDDTASVLSALASDFTDGLPKQGQYIEEIDTVWTHRVTAKVNTDSLPIVKISLASPISS